MTEEEKQKILEVLNSKKIVLECPLCHNRAFSIPPFYVLNDIKKELLSGTISRRMPSVLLVCNNCGYMSQHALGVLGLLKQDEETIEEMNNERWLKAAIYWIWDMANPNEGMTHPLDDDKLKSVANLMSSLHVDLDEKTIADYAQSLGIVDDSIELIINTFKEAKRRKFNIMGRFPEDFLKLRLKDIAKERLGE